MHLCVCVCAYVHVCVSMCIYVFLYVCMRVYVYLSLCICLYDYEKPHVTPGDHKLVVHGGFSSSRLFHPEHAKRKTPAGEHVLSIIFPNEIDSRLFCDAFFRVDYIKQL